LQTTSQAQALDFLARDLSQVLAFSWAVSTVGLVTDFFDIPNDALGKIDTYINGTGPEEQQDLISRLQAEANAQLDAFVGVENSLSRVTDAINGPDEFKPNDPESMLDDGGGFINGARTFISILQI